MTERSPKVTPAQGEAWARALAPVLFPGEIVWAFATASRYNPFSVATAITNARVIGFTTSGDPLQRVTSEVRADDIVGFDLSVRQGLLPSLVVTAGFGETDFGKFQPGEAAYLHHVLTELNRRGTDPVVPLPPRHRVDSSAAELSPSAGSDVVESPDRPAAASAPQSSPAASAPSLAQEIAQLAELHRQGILDDDEFRAAKQAAITAMASRGRSTSLKKGG
ncbi:SHOCT domain-containing protein [Gordonia sp. NPDC003504]